MKWLEDSGEESDDKTSKLSLNSWDWSRNTIAPWSAN